jgi:uncharacterized integral membrane protein
MKYDQKILLDAAQRFHNQAKWVVYTCAAKYAITATIAAFIGFAAWANIAPATVNGIDIASVLIPCGILGLLIGVAVGTARAFHLRVETQKLLVLVEVERNTRRSEIES